MSALDYREVAPGALEPRFVLPSTTSVAKEVLDRSVAALLLAILGLPMIIVALAIKATSPGPVFFRQERVGRGGRTFFMWKFRSMVDGADRQLPPNEADGLLFKIRSDPRVTPLGRLLRRWSIDELPQILNVVRGDMSMVGPRPLPVALEDFDAVAVRRLAVKPGITGLWQVNGRSDAGWDECLRLDLAYVESRSLLLDLSILVRTAGAVLRRAGAY